jgi:vitamin K-dependent gamma-carboxylase
MIPRWSLWILRLQVGVIYFFGGVAKINPDWIHGEPMRSWLLARRDSPLIDLIVRNQLELFVFSYGGLMFDLLVVPALVWRRTRPFAFVAAVVFHVINSQLFAIGIFPWMMIAATTLFFEPDWPRRVMLLVRPRTTRDTAAPAPVGSAFRGRAVSRPVAALLALYVAVQILVPLRHFAYPGNVSWTEEGHLLAWRMKLRDKTGSASFIVSDRSTGQTTIVDPATMLEPWQVTAMVARPDMLLQFAHFLADQRGGSARVEVRVRSLVSLNRGGMRPMIDPRADLATEPRTLWPAWWIERGDDR